MSSLLENLQLRVRSLLKAHQEGEEEGEGGAEMMPPPESDPRLAGSAPDADDMDDASQESTVGQEQGGADDGQDEGASEGAEEGAEGADESGASEDGGSGAEDFDEHGNHDLNPDELRKVTKSYGNGTGFETPEEFLNGGADLQALLEGLLQIVEDQQALQASQNRVIDELRSEVNRLMVGMQSGDRKISKALSVLESIAPEHEIPEPPPAPAPKPRAITKSIPQPPTPSRPATDSATQLFLDLKAGKVSVRDAMAGHTSN